MVGVELDLEDDGFDCLFEVLDLLSLWDSAFGQNVAGNTLFVGGEVGSVFLFWVFEGFTVILTFGLEWV